MHNINKKKAIIALKKAKTSIEKNIELIDKWEYCEKIIIQNMAAIGLIKSSNNNLIEEFLSNCEQDQETKKAALLKLFQLSHK